VKCLTLIPVLLLTVSTMIASPKELNSPCVAATWTGAVSTNWNVAGNWSNSAIPSSSTNVTIPSNLSRYPVISLANANAASITLSSGSGAQPTLTVSAFTLTVAGNLAVNAGTMTQSGGTINVTAGSFNVAGHLTQTGGTLLSSVILTVMSNGVLAQSAGIIHLASTIGTTPTDNIAISPNGTINQSGGTIDALDITIQNNATYNQSGTGLLKLYEDYINSGSFISTSGTIEFADNATTSSWPTATATDQFYDVTVDAGVTANFDKAGTIKIAGDWTNDGFVLVLTSSDIIEFNGSNPQTIGGSGTSIFYGLYMTGSGVKTAAITILAFVLDNGGSSNTAATLDMGSNALIALSLDNTGGTIKFSGATNGMAIATGTVTYSGTAQTMASGTYNAISVVAAGTKTAGGAITASSLNLNSGSTFDIAGNTLTLNGAVTGTGVLKGSSTSNMVIGAAAGTLNFDQTSAATRSLKNLTFNSGSSATLGNALDVYGDILLTTSTLNLATKNLTLKSTSSYTARIGNLTGSTLSNATNVTVERFIKDAGGATGGRRYRLLGPTVNTSGSIKANWMEGGMNTAIGVNVNPVPGYGTQITGAGGNTNGFDVTQSNQASLYLTTNGSTLNYTSISNTSGTLNAKTGYFLFIRGDRSMAMTLASAPNLPTSSTTLRTTGSLITGTQTGFTNALIGGAGKLNLITNPYPSAIDWALVQPACSNITQYYTMWDPEIGTRGAFVTVKTDGTKSNSSSAATTKIQSGQAFFVEASGSSTPAVSLQEGHKSTGDNSGVFRGAGDPAESFAIDLYTQMPDSTFRNADGVLAVYDNNYSESIDGDDANEINNWDENIAIARESNRLAIESRPVIVAVDTLPLFMNNMKQQTYQFVFTPTSFTNTYLKAELIDNFLGTRSQLSVVNSTTVTFDITADPASKATNRFEVVFGPSGPLPVTFTEIKAYKQNAAIAVEWKVANQVNIHHYEIERSTDGASFSYLATQAASGNNGSDATYNYTDINAKAGDNFYRVRSVGIGGDIKYSSIVKVNIAKTNAGISVYPNPVVGATMGLQFSNIDKGNYNISMFNSMGQKVFGSTVQHSGGNATKMIELPNAMAPGVYEVLISGGDNVKINLRVTK